MKLKMTFRNLSQEECQSAAEILNRCFKRIDRLIESPTPVRVVIEGGPPEHHIQLELSENGLEMNSSGHGYDLTQVISTATERLRVQLVKNRKRRTNSRYRTGTYAAV